MGRAAAWGAAGGLIGGAGGALLGKAVPYLGQFAGRALNTVRSYASTVATRAAATARQVAAASAQVTKKLGASTLARFSSGPSPAQITTNLASRASQINASLGDRIAENSRTTAVLSTKCGPNYVGSGGRDISPKQRAMLGDDEIESRLPRAHAEVTAVTSAMRDGMIPRGMGTSRDICPACRDFLEESGATILNSRTAWWEGR